MANREEKVKKLCKIFANSDISSEEYKDYLDEEAKAIETLLESSLLTLPEMRAEFETFVKTIRSNYLHFLSCLALGTFKKLCPDATAEEKRDMYFAAWMVEWHLVLSLGVDDYGDGCLERNSKPSLPVLLGAANTVCMVIIANNTVHNMAEDRLATKPYLRDLMKLFRDHFASVMYSLMIDNSGGKYNKLMDSDWQNTRVYTSVIRCALEFPVDVAFCVAGKNKLSDVGQYCLKLAPIVGTFGRNYDDFVDMESDTKGGSFNWAFQTAWQVATAPQRVILQEYINHQLAKTSTDPADIKASTDAVIKLYAELDIKSKFQAFRDQQMQKFELALEGCPHQFPRNTWKTCMQFVDSIYEEVGGY